MAERGAKAVIPAVPPVALPPAGGLADREMLVVLLLGAVGGLVIGAAVAGVRTFVGDVQGLLFGVDVDMFGSAGVAPWRVVLVPLAGGLVLGLLLAAAGRLGRLAIVDPVEANALEGGRMSMVDSLVLVGLSMVSISIGGSVGFEAAMTQLGAGLLSVVGQRLGLTRRALRILVSCGTGAGIAAIFDAPLAGTLYALELVVGGYAVRALLPTLVAAATSGLATHLLVGYTPMFLAHDVGLPTLWHLPLALLVGAAAAVVGIAVMRGTTAFEGLLVRLRVPSIGRPVAGGLLLGLLAVAAPEVMGPGHNGIDEILAGQNAAGALAAVLLAKMAASIVCVGSGFRGGLFSASLFLGAALACVLHGVVVVPLLGPDAPIELTVVAGMAGVAASIVGTPIAIVLLAVETAGLNAGVVTVAVSVVVAAHLTRRFFGYSFSTWRFHVRGRELLGPRDVGRLQRLTLADVPLAEPVRVAAGTPLAEAARASRGAALPVVAVEAADGAFVGLVRRDRLADAAADEPAAPIDGLAADAPPAAPRDRSLARLVDAPIADVAGALAVVDGDGRLVGVVEEAAALARYLDELVAADDDDAGPLSPKPAPGSP